MPVYYANRYNYRGEKWGTSLSLSDPVQLKSIKEKVCVGAGFISGWWSRISSLMLSKVN
jgi:hypothetical protein